MHTHLNDAVKFLSTVLDARVGLDQEMPGGTFFASALKTAVEQGNISTDILDKKVLHILTSMFQFGLFDRPPSGSLNANSSSDSHNAIAREIASGSMVLLKNSGVLPLVPGKKIIAVGDAGHIAPVVVGKINAKTVSLIYLIQRECFFIFTVTAKYLSFLPGLRFSIPINFPPQ